MVHSLPSDCTIGNKSKPPSGATNEPQPLVFDPSISSIPSEFVWPDHEKPSLDAPELVIPAIDIGVLSSSGAVSKAAELVNEACKKHGFFLVVNHGVESGLLDKALQDMDLFFCLKHSEKKKAQRKVGENYGYANSFIGRFFSKLPWKETLSCRYSPDIDNILEQYLVSVMGEDFRHLGYVKSQHSIP